MYMKSSRIALFLASCPRIPCLLLEIIGIKSEFNVDVGYDSDLASLALILRHRKQWLGCSKGRNSCFSFKYPVKCNC